VVNGGRVVELGKHDELLAQDGLYADLVRVQLGGDEASTSAKLNAMESAVAAVVEAVAVIYAEDVELSSFTKTAFEEDAKKSRNTESNKQAGKVEKEKSAPVAAVEEAPLSKEESRRVSRRIWGMVAKYPGWVLLGFFGALCFGGAFPVWGYYLAKAQAMYFVESTHVLRVKAIGTAVAFIVLGVVTIGGATLQFWCIGRVGEYVSTALRSQLFESLLRREIAYFDKEENSVGALTTKLAEDSRAVTKASGENVAIMLQSLATLLLGLAIAFWASWKIALVVLATFPINIIANVIQMRVITGAG